MVIPEKKNDFEIQIWVAKTVCTFGNASKIMIITSCNILDLQIIFFFWAKRVLKQSHSQFHLQKSHANTEVTSILGMSESSVPEIQEKLDLVDELSSGKGKKQQINCASQVFKIFKKESDLEQEAYENKQTTDHWIWSKKKQSNRSKRVELVYFTLWTQNEKIILLSIPRHREMSSCIQEGVWCRWSQINRYK